MAEKKLNTYVVGIRKEGGISEFNLKAHYIELGPSGLVFYKIDPDDDSESEEHMIVASVPRYVYVREEVATDVVDGD